MCCRSEQKGYSSPTTVTKSEIYFWRLLFAFSHFKIGSSRSGADSTMSQQWLYYTCNLYQSKRTRYFHGVISLNTYYAWNYVTLKLRTKGSLEKKNTNLYMLAYVYWLQGKWASPNIFNNGSITSNLMKCGRWFLPWNITKYSLVIVHCGQTRSYYSEYAGIPMSNLGDTTNSIFLFRFWDSLFFLTYGLFPVNKYIA